MVKSIKPATKIHLIGMLRAGRQITVRKKSDDFLLSFFFSLDKPYADSIRFSGEAELCKGSTTDSDSVCEGSNPSPAAI